MRHHPEIDIEYWKCLFPLESFEKRSGPRRYATTEPDDPEDLWKATGSEVSSPADLAKIEHVRAAAARQMDLGEAVPVDLFLWAVGDPIQPYLTKIGGTPHREASREWPKSSDGSPMTFVAQFCFLDSVDLFRRPLPGDVLLFFMTDPDSCFDRPPRVAVEWSTSMLTRPITPAECPPPAFPVPRLAGHIHRMNEFPDSYEAFLKLGHYGYYWFPVTQSSKIGTITFACQDSTTPEDWTLLCALASFRPRGKWPLVNLEALPADYGEGGMHGRGEYTMMFFDLGNVYFCSDKSGNVHVTADSF